MEQSDSDPPDTTSSSATGTCVATTNSGTNFHNGNSANSLKDIFPSSKIKSILRQEKQIGRIYTSAIDLIGELVELVELVTGFMSDFMSRQARHKALLSFNSSFSLFIFTIFVYHNII